MKIGFQFIGLLIVITILFLTLYKIGKIEKSISGPLSLGIGAITTLVKYIRVRVKKQKEDREFN